MICLFNIQRNTGTESNAHIYFHPNSNLRITELRTISCRTIFHVFNIKITSAVFRIEVWVKCGLSKALCKKWTNSNIHAICYSATNL